MLDELLDALDALDAEDIQAEAVEDILAVCKHPVFKILREFCDVFEPQLEHHHVHPAWHGETNDPTMC